MSKSLKSAEFIIPILINGVYLMSREFNHHISLLFVLVHNMILEANVTKEFESHALFNLSGIFRTISLNFWLIWFFDINVIYES